MHGDKLHLIIGQKKKKEREKENGESMKEIKGEKRINEKEQNDRGRREK